MRKTWFKVGRISTERNDADLNTKALALRRRQVLLRRCGCRGDGIPEEEEEGVQLGGQPRLLVRAVAALLSVHLQGCGERGDQHYQGMGSHTMRFGLEAEEQAINNRNDVNYLVIMAITAVFAVATSWRLTTIYFPRTTTWIWTTTMWIWTTTTSMSSRIWTWILHRGHREQAPGEMFVSESEEEVNLKKYTYLEEFGGKLEMIVYNIEYDRMFIVPAVCPGGSREEDIDMNFVYYTSEDGRWKIKVKGARNREGTTHKWKFFMELNEEDAKSAWERRLEILKKGYVKKRQYNDEFLEMMTRESGIVTASEEARRTRFNEYMQDELQLLGEIQPGEGDEVPDLDYVPTTPEDEVAAGGEQDGEVAQQIGEEGQRGEEQEEDEHYPIPSGAGDSDDRGSFGDNHIPRVFGDWTPQEERELVFGTRNKKKHYVKSENMTDKEETSTWRMQSLRLLLHLRVWRNQVSSTTCWKNFEMEWNHMQGLWLRQQWMLQS